MWYGTRVTGETKWIQPINPYNTYDTYALGSYQENNSNDNSYKILRYSRGRFGKNHVFEIYEINSNPWRILDITLDDDNDFISSCMSLKGKTYWIAGNLKEKPFDIFLISFDYTTERLECLCLSCQYPSYQNVSLSVVRKEKLSVLIQREITSETEIWVINKIGETKVVSWSMVLAVDVKSEHGIWDFQNFFFDEDKKVLVCCGNMVYEGKTSVYIVGS